MGSFALLLFGQGRLLTADSVEKSLISFEQAAESFISLLESLEKKAAQERE
jgi:hypothetical protein